MKREARSGEREAVARAARMALPLIVAMVLVLPFNIRPKNGINQGLVAFSGLAEIF
jgi:hypothetical protein